MCERGTTRGESLKKQRKSISIRKGGGSSAMDASCQSYRYTDRVW